MYKYSIVRLSMIASIAIVYAFLPVLGLLKAYATGSNQWYWLCSTWALPIISLFIIPVVENYRIRKFLKGFTEKLKSVLR